MKDRLTQSATYYQLIDGTRIADDWADLTDGTIQAGINLDDEGVEFPGSLFVWTGSESDGDAEVSTCNGFTSKAGTDTGASGFTADTNLDWTNGASRACDRQARLYCIEQ